jgi:hypothetical protein
VTGGLLVRIQPEEPNSLGHTPLQEGHFIHVQLPRDKYPGRPAGHEPDARSALQHPRSCVEVKFKPISGREDQAGGLVWRAKDSNNYDVARANALEDSVTIYHTVNGRRIEKKRANMKVASNQWHTLRVEFQGSHFTVMCDGNKALEWDDETFKDAGNPTRRHPSGCGGPR